jgi:hypothetical protein
MKGTGGGQRQLSLGGCAYQSTTEHEVLPNQDTVFVTSTMACQLCSGRQENSLIELLRLVHTSAPDSEHVLVSSHLSMSISIGKKVAGGTYHQLDPSAETSRLDFCKETVGWDPVTTATEDTDAVDLKDKAGAFLSLERLLDDLGGAEGDTLRGRVENGPVLMPVSDHHHVINIPNPSAVHSTSTMAACRDQWGTTPRLRQWKTGNRVSPWQAVCHS